LFGSTLLIPTVLNLTPLACLAIVLIAVGYKLTSHQLYRSMYGLGHPQFLPFIVTVIAIVFTDLLKGVVIGLIFGLFFVIRANHHAALTVVKEDHLYLFRFNKDATFVNKNELRTKLRALPSNSHVILDGTKALYIDQDILEVVDDFRQLAGHKNITVEYKRFEAVARVAGAH
jgi:MFS superfamily sulfate permease-like transporter